MVLIIDASTSIVDQWSNMKDFLKSLIERFSIDADHANIAAVTYSSENKQSLVSELVDDIIFIESAIGKSNICDDNDMT